MNNKTPGHFRRIDGGIIVNIKVIPRSSVNEIAGVKNNELRVKLTAPPVDGAANKSLIAFLSEYLSDITVKAGKVRKSDISIIKGATSGSKQVEIRGIDRI